MNECRECRACAAPGPRPDRRAFLERALPAAAVALTGLSFAASAEAWAGRDAPGGPAAGERRYPVPAADGATVDRDGGVVVVRHGSRVFAFALACPHEGAGLRWRPADVRFQCPRHESKFQPDGTFIEGKARRHMDRLPVRKEGAEIVVDPTAPIRSDRQREAWLAAAVTI